MIITRAPLRIPLGGGGTDFPGYYLKYGGYILGFALNRYVYVVLHDTIDKKIRLKYSKTEIVDSVDQLENRIAAEALDAYGITEGVEIATFSDVPEASGLGGSSAFCVALVTALRAKLGIPLDQTAIFASAYDIERIKAGQPGGIQDQFFAAHGGAWELDLGEDVVQIRLDGRIPLGGLLANMSLVYTGTGRTNLDIASNQTKKVSKMDPSMIANLDKTKRLGQSIRSLIAHGDYDSIGTMMGEHWENKKARDPSITNPTIDSLYSKAIEAGALGGKLLGLGGGGYLLLYSKVKLDGMPCLPLRIDSDGTKVVFSSAEA